MIGGDQPDVLRGGNGEDILIGGLSSFEDDEAALILIREEWTSSRDVYSRASNIYYGSGPILDGTGVFLRFNETIFSDDDDDYLDGGSGIDWLL